MNGAQIHLMINHFPVVGLFIAVGFWLAGVVLSRPDLQRSAKIVMVGVAIFAVPTFLSGEPASNVILGLPDVSKNLIHEHEEVAELSFVLMLSGGFLAGLSLWLKERYQKMFKVVGIALALASLFTVAKAAHEGGKIRHSELRSK